MIKWLLGERWRIIVSGILITTTPLLGLALYVKLSLTSDLEKIALENRTVSAAAIAHILEERMEGDIAYAQAFASRPLLQMALQGGDIAGMRSHLENLVKLSKSFERGLVCSPSGVRIVNYPPDPAVIGGSVANRDWFKGVMQSRQAYVSEFYLREAQPRRYLFSIAVPVESSDGELLGILQVAPKEGYFKALLDGFNEHDSAIVKVVDKKGNLVYHPRHAVDSLIDLSFVPGVAKVKTGLEGADKYVNQETGEQVVAAFHPLDRYGLGVVTELPLKEALAPVNRLTSGLYLVLGAMSLLGGLFAFRRAELLHKAQTLAGQLTERTTELEEVNSHLNQKTAELGKQSEQLEETVAERTAGLMLEINARRQAEEALRRANAYNRSLIEASIDPFVTIGVNGEITDVNSATEMVTGYGRRELAGTDFCKYFTEPEQARKGYELVFNKGAVRDYQLEILHRDGHVTPVLYNGAVYLDENGAVAGVFASVRDITVQRSLENQLRQAQKMEAVGTLAGGIAHDFNNILTAIIGFASLMETKMSANDPLHANLTQILASADRAANLTRSMLAFSRKQLIDVKPLDLNLIVSRIEQMLRRLIREDIILQLDLAPGELTVMADAGQIEQVLLNLATNARDAVPAGGTIRIGTAPAKLDEGFRMIHGYGEPGDYVMLTFSDSGAGMEEAIRQRIFEPFFTTKEVGRGSGLGLAVCYGIVKQHNGYINVQSEPNSGTVFRIYLPLVLVTPQPEEDASETFGGGGNETILVAEDDAVVRGLTAGILREFGYRVVEAEDGEEALARFAEHGDEIDLCLFDMIMPQKNGRDAFAEILKMRPAAKALFMSGYPADYYQAGDMHRFGGFISKPVRPQELLGKLREILDKQPEH